MNCHIRSGFRIFNPAWYIALFGSVLLSDKNRICRKYVIASFKPKEHFNNASQSSRNIKIFNEYKFRICLVSY